MKTKKMLKPVVALLLAFVIIASVSIIAFAGYHEWEYEGTTTVICESGALWWKEIVSKHELSSYVYENLTDQKGSRAVCEHYKYNPDTETYKYGWTNDDDCYARARVETVLGAVVLDSGRKYAQYRSTAETDDLAVGIAHTYCGNDAA